MFYEHERKEKDSVESGINTDYSMYPKPHHIGEFKPMEDYLTNRGLNYTLAVFNDWFPWQHKGLRIFIPAVSRIPDHHYWQARGIEGQDLRYDSPYGPRRDALIVVKSFVKCDTICIVEGPMDALAMAECTGVMGIALMGIMPPLEAKEHLVSLCQEHCKIYCVADRDHIAGMLAIQLFLVLHGVKNTSLAFPPKKDIADCILRERRELISEV